MTNHRVPIVAGALPLLEREIVRFYRQRNRIVGAVVQPLVFWMLLGFGLRASFRGDATTPDYFEYAYPGIVMLTLLFTAIFATISIIEDRKDGFLQGVLAAPVSRSSIVLGKVFGAAVIALFQGVLYLALAPFAGVTLTVPSALLAFVTLIPIAVALAALGFILAWRLDSTQGFHALMNVLLLPMWLLSGAFFPSTGAATPLAIAMNVNPLTYGLRAFRSVLHGGALGDDRSLFVHDLVVTIAFAVVALALATVAARRRERT